FIETVTTDDSGGFEGQVETSSLPCALQVTGEGTAQRLHSYTDAPGTVNITPFTDLIIALTATITPTTWFDQEDRTTAVGELEQQKNLFLNTLQEKNYTFPGDDFDPFSTRFEINDDADQLLEAFSAALADSPTIANYEELVNLISSGNLGSIPEALTSPATPEPE
ncbi:unnamed protein product, partial [Ectocarpus sp. 12 AP-2014]